jgi:hypothetical protein
MPRPAESSKEAHEVSNLRRFQMNVISRIVALVAFLLAAASTHADIIRDSTGYPANPEWVNGGRVMGSYINGLNYGVTGLRGLNLSQDSQVYNICGVMTASNSNFNWRTNIQSIRINIFSSASSFAANPLLGDVYTQTGASIENLAGTAPPAWGGVNWNGFTNRYVDLGFTPFILPAGNYIVSVLFSINSGFLLWTEVLHDFGLPGDIVAFNTLPGQFFEYTGSPVYTTGDAAVMFEARPVPEPGSLLLLGCAALGIARRRREALPDGSSTPRLNP